MLATTSETYKKDNNFDAFGQLLHVDGTNIF
jgi:hypothetical protein